MMVNLSQEQHTNRHNHTVSKFTLLPTRQQLQALLKAKGADPQQLDRMTYTDQIRLTKEYCQLMQGC